MEADDGYVGEAPEYVKCPASFVNPEETLYMQQRVRNRQETVNKRFKNWGVLKQVYRHEFILYSNIFQACAVVTQIAIKRGEPLFTCGYCDPPYEDNYGDAFFWSIADEEESVDDEGISYVDNDEEDEDISYDETTNNEW